jgi:hypothetical protein
LKVIFTTYNIWDLKYYHQNWTVSWSNPIDQIRILRNLAAKGYRRAVFNESTGEYKTTSATSSVKGEHCMPQRECQKTKIQRLNIILTILPINSKETDRLGKGWCVQI